MGELPLIEGSFRIALAAVLGALVGLDRELTDRPAGFRTHILVSVGAALFAMAGAFGVGTLIGDAETRGDPTRVAAQVVTGIGFLGAGAIIQRGISVRGLTTAAGLWVTAAIGLAVGLGFYEGAVIATVVTVAALFGLKRFESRFLSRLKPGLTDFTVEAKREMRLGALTDLLEEKGLRFETVNLETGFGGERLLTARIQLSDDTDPSEIADALMQIEGVENVDYSD